MLRRGPVTLALAAGLTVAATGTAAADTLSLTDPGSDLLAYTMESQEGTPAPAVRNGDVVRTVVKHGTRRITVRLRFRDLKRTGEMRADTVRLVTDEGVRRDVNVLAFGGAWRGDSGMSRPDGQEVRCDGLAHRIDYDRNTVTVSVPRTCVSNPRWVRVGAGSFWGTGELFYVDDAQRNQSIDDSRLRLSARVRRG